MENPKRPRALGILVLMLAGLGLWVASRGPERGGAAPEEQVAVRTPQTEPAEPADTQAPAPLTGGASGPAGVRSAMDEAAAAGRSELEIREEGGGTIGGARVVCVRDRSLVAAGTADADGQVSFPADSDEVDLFVAGAGRPVHRTATLLRPGFQVVHLPAGARVEGTVRDGAGQPVPDLRLSLRADQARPAWTLSFDLWEELGFSTPPLWLWTTTAADGSFSFRGLGESWSGSIGCRYEGRITEASSGTIVGDGAQLRLEQPTTGLMLRVEPAHFLRARLVEKATGLPADGVSVQLRIRFADRQNLLGASAETDEGGSFRVRVSSPQLESVALRLGEVPIRTFTASEIPRNLDLGEIRIDRLREVPFIVADIDGAPVSRGIGSIEEQQSEPTDAGGNGVVRNVPPGRRTMRVVAAGYVPHRVAVPETVSEPLPVTLEPGNRLEVRLRAGEGMEPDAFHVGVSCDAGVLRDPDQGILASRDHLAELAFTKQPTIRDERVVSLYGKANAQGVVVFQALEPGRPLRLQVLTWPREKVYHETTLPPLGPTEERVTEVDLSDGLHVFRGRVVDADGNPLVHAWIDLTGHGVQQLTGEDGTFSLTTPSTEATTLLVQKTGFAARYLHDYRIPLDGAPVEFRLHPERRVRVRVVDANGVAIAVARLFIQKEGFSITTQELGEGRFEITELDETPFTIVAEVAGRRYEQRHDPVIPEAEVVVPVHGSVRVAVEGTPLHEARGRFLVALRADLGEETIWIDRPFTWGSRHDVAFRFVYPAEYAASLHYFPSDEEKRSGAEESSRDLPTMVLVEAGAEAVLEIRVD